MSENGDGGDRWVSQLKLRSSQSQRFQRREQLREDHIEERGKDWNSAHTASIYAA